MRTPKIFVLLCAVVPAALIACLAPATRASVIAVDDAPRGWLVIEGGSYPTNPVVARRFRELIGGANAKVLIVPTASSDAQLTPGASDTVASGLGLTNYEVLHTRDREQANSESFAARVRQARGVWFGGGRPGRLAEAYVGTRTARELDEFYREGGVIGGTSAGAMSLSSFLVRGGVDNDDFRNLISKKNRQGFGFLPDAAIDVHINQRPNGEGDLAQVVAAYPGLLGIGVDAGTAIVVHGRQFEVIGGANARVTITDGLLHDGKPYYFLSLGDRFDLSRRVATRASRTG